MSRRVRIALRASCSAAARRAQAGAAEAAEVKALIGEAQHDPQIAAALNERFIAPQADKTVSRLETARDQGQLSPAFDLGLAMAILSGPLYFQLLITQDQLTHAYVDRILDALFAGMGPSHAC
ncbi:TetR-like C-terminal domain-containing protein [Microbispora amethystogenes]|uniref:TetR-like C-terminal domain-containing protein n=1 Tax=Microbispora amethystogenes TaxID=1427754 RepID=UPI0033E1CF3A